MWQQSSRIDQKGLLLCAKYSVAPNFFGYCGPEENRSLVDHLRQGVADKEVRVILSQFETLFLNLQLIARENKIADPFDRQVVEAYWVGNILLKHIKNSDYIYLLKERFSLERKIGEVGFAKLKHKFLTNNLLPHHSFHVFNIFKRTGNLVVGHTLETMDQCRIGWGKIIMNGELRIKNLVTVEAKQLTINNKHLSLGSPSVKQLRVDYKGKSFNKNLKQGDWVSFHWGFVCDILTGVQVRNLELYTQKAIEFFNQ